MKKQLLFALIMGLAFAQSAYAAKCGIDDPASVCIDGDSSDSDGTQSNVDRYSNLTVECGSNPQAAGNVDKSFSIGGGGSPVGLTAYGGSARGAGG